MYIAAKSSIKSYGAYFPEEVVSSKTLMEESSCDRFGIPVGYLERITGIFERRIASSTESPSDLAYKASLIALDRSGLEVEDIDLIVYTGIAKDCVEPSTAHFVQKKLNASSSYVLDVSNACLGFFSGLHIADMSIASGLAKNVLVCTGEKSSDVLYPFLDQLKVAKDKNEYRMKIGALTLGDAGGAIIASSDGGNGKWCYGKFISDGRYTDLCKYDVNANGISGQMLMEEICTTGVSMHNEMIGSTLKSLQWNSSEIGKLYCHQVGARPTERLAELSGVSMETVPITYDKFGNLTSATFPALLETSSPVKGEKIIILGSGSGMSIFQGGLICN